MPRPGRGAWWSGAFSALILSWALLGIGQPQAEADVSAVSGSAFGYSFDVSFFGGPPATGGPTPTVVLPAGGSAAPVTATAPAASVVVGPAKLFSSGPITVSTQGTTGPTGSVTSSTTIDSVNTSGQEALTAAAIGSTCTASDAGVTGSTTITGGTVQTSDTGGPGGTPVVVPVPAAPAPNTAIDGELSVGDTFRYVFNEQIENPDGSLTVNAVHLILLGPTAVGNLIIGQSVCGATVTAATTTTSTTVGATTTTSTTAPTTTTTAAPGGGTPVSGRVGGGAFGYFTSVGLFGGAPATRGPSPTVTLPATGSAEAITDTAASGDARYGPGIIFSSGRITVSTEGTPGPTGSVTSSATITTINASGQEILSAASVSSTCTATEAAGASGSTTIEGGRLQTSAGDPNVTGDETFVTIPASPPANTVIEGKLEDVGDSFRYVFNEQIVKDGAITVNAAHQILLGPTAVGDLVIGQSRCATNDTALSTTDADPVTGSGDVSARRGGTATGGLARTGGDAGRLVGLGLAFVALGWLAIRLGLGRQPSRAHHGRGPTRHWPAFLRWR